METVNLNISQMFGQSEMADSQHHQTFFFPGCDAEEKCTRQLLTMIVDQTTDEEAEKYCGEAPLWE